MHKQITKMLEHIASSQMEMANILEAKRHVAVHMSQLVHNIAEQYPNVDGVEMLTEHSLDVAKNIAVYLSSLADLEEALAENLSYVMKEVDMPDGEE
ncbi:nucleoside-diphosphate sugar epimerase [Paenibacillus doosanensis]|uniref:Nucleoside-diphosphate sugar epimerase n=1 Tax=Paenibacillus konkukensis TaxID=2020716 RepID=A0ABY4RYP5_9BACL|nr:MULTISPECIES: nucleoside-diphosphate sugar epimerase [Paenibacillus]MCS7458819.1 nucleoside-diphosphate sugar epimerase [Paenibacillus doosanensis]UQZ86653.1 hypothetical protein SK3146_05946 [Paenibacillus konkukensis]